MRDLVFLICALALPVAGCSETGGAGGSGGSAVDPDLADHQRLTECGDDSVCASAFAQRIDGGDPFSLSNVECLLIALRDRSPGLYRIELDHTFTGGSEREEHAFAITASGGIESGVADSWYDEDPLESSTSYLSTERCEPKPAAFFDACLTEVGRWEEYTAQEAQAAWDCVFPALGQGPPWFVDCVPQSPTCE